MTTIIDTFIDLSEKDPAMAFLIVATSLAIGYGALCLLLMSVFPNKDE